MPNDRRVVKINSLYREVRSVLEQARAGAYRAVNAAMVQAYWHVGRLIVEHEQGGTKRAAYGEAVLEGLSRQLTTDFGRGFDPSNLRYMQLFFQKFPNRDAVRHTLPSAGNRDALRHELKPAEKWNATRSASPALRAELSWTHYRLLLGVEDERARDWYMQEAADQHWSTRQLERQISVLYYERLLASRKKAPVRKEAREKLAAVGPEEFIRDPYVLEFLNLRDYPALRESKIEQAIIDNLQSFLLELGKGFAFVARQRRMRFEDQDFYVDLVFYNFLLRCFVLIDLKVGSLTHQDIGQMDGYVRVFDAQARPEGRQPHHRPDPVFEEERGHRPLLGARRGAPDLRRQVPPGSAERRHAAPRTGARARSARIARGRRATGTACRTAAHHAPEDIVMPTDHRARRATIKRFDQRIRYGTWGGTRDHRRRSQAGIR